MRAGIRRWKQWIADEAGQDLLEYALLASLIAIAAFVGVSQVASTIRGVFWDAIAAAAF